MPTSPPVVIEFYTPRPKTLRVTGQFDISVPTTDAPSRPSAALERDLARAIRVVVASHATKVRG